MNTDPKKSAQPCGCDEGANWTCEACLIKQRGSRIMKTAQGGEILVVCAPEGLQGLTHAKKRGSEVYGEDALKRKEYPVFTGFLAYFPDAIAAVAQVSKKGNDQHNPGEPLHWAREKSTDQMDTATRHMTDHGTGFTKDSDGGYHLAKAIWRLCAELQLTIEKERAQ